MCKRGEKLSRLRERDSSKLQAEESVWRRKKHPFRARDCFVRCTLHAWHLICGIILSFFFSEADNSHVALKGTNGFVRLIF